MIQSKIVFDIGLVGDSEYIIGLDEVGWGSFAGDIVIGACAVPKSFYKSIPGKDDILSFVDDSKKVKESKRAALADMIQNKFFVGIGHGTVDRINSDGMSVAYQDAFEEAVSNVLGQISATNFVTVLDGSRKVASELDIKLMVKGDAKSFAIGCASVCAKVHRDAYMTKLHEEFPVYDWINNKGYGSPKHLAGIASHGPCLYHRDKFIKTYQENHE